MNRAFIAVRGEDRIAFLQGILTQDVTKLAAARIQFAALLSPQGKILHDMFLIYTPDTILIDTQELYVEILIKRLTMYKLRAKVTVERILIEAMIRDVPSPLPDPRHPDLPHYSPRTTHDALVTLGIPELGRDFVPDEVVALDAGYDLLNAVSFTKGCYVGQEVTARMHYKHIARRAFYVLESDIAPPRLALLKFEEVEDKTEPYMLEGTAYRPRLPEWLAPKYAQYLANMATTD